MTYTNRGLIKTEDPSLLRDPRNGAIINNDMAAYKAFLSEREKGMRIESVAKEIQELQDDVSQIKRMLQQLLNGKTNG